MPSISATLQISSSGLADLQAIPQQLESLVNGAQSNLSSIHTGAAAGNPFSALLGNFQGLAGQTANLPDLGPVLAPVQSLAKDLPDAGFASIDHLTRGVDEMLGVFGPVKDLLLAGKLESHAGAGCAKSGRCRRWITQARR